MTKSIYGLSRTAWAMRLLANVWSRLLLLFHESMSDEDARDVGDAMTLTQQAQFDLLNEEESRRNGLEEWKVKRYWLSWIQCTDDYRPMTYPPGGEILGWWCSGYDADHNATLCALVKADSPSLAKSAVEQDWPEAASWRFVEEVSDDWRPTDRFPLSDWMLKRLEQIGARV